MFSALFPVQKDVMTDGLPGAETPGSAKNGGEGEKNDRFARLLFVSLENATNEEKTTEGTPGETPLWTNGIRSLHSLAASLFEENAGEGALVFADAPEEEPSVQVIPDDSLTGLFASVFAASRNDTAQITTAPETPAIEVSLENEVLETLPQQAETGEPEYSSRNAQLLDEALSGGTPSADVSKGARVQAASPESTQLLVRGEKGAFALPESFEAVAPVDSERAINPELQEALGRLRTPSEPTTAQPPEALQAEKGQSVADARAGSFPVETGHIVHRSTGQTGSENRQPETSLRPSIVAATSHEGGKAAEMPDASSARVPRTVSFAPAQAAATGTETNPEMADLKTESTGASVPFSLSMTDNVRPRRSFSLAEQGSTVAEDEGKSTAGVRSDLRTSLRTQILSAASPQTPEAGSAEKPVTDLTAATASERALKAAVEEKLSTNRLTEGREQEQGIFPAVRNLFGEAETGKNVSPAGAAQQEASKPFTVLKDSLKGDDFGQQPGKEAAESAVYSAASKPLQTVSQQHVSFANLLSGETRLQGRGGAAVEDGIQHVVRFLRTEGRQAASIIVDPPALGRIEIELVSIAKGVEASIKVASEQVRQLVQDHITVLRNHLEQQGVHLGEFVVDLRDNSKGNSGQNTFAGEKNSRRRGASVLESESIDETVPSFRMDLEHGLLSWVA